MDKKLRPIFCRLSAYFLCHVNDKRSKYKRYFSKKVSKIAPLISDKGRVIELAFIYIDVLTNSALKYLNFNTALDIHRYHLRSIN